MNNNIRSILTLSKALQEKRGNPVFLYISGIRPSAVIEARRQIIKFKKQPQNLGKTTVDIVIRSGGGSAEDAYRLVKLFRNNFTEVNVIVPFWAKSAATIFCLGASNLILDSCGELGPIDAQVYNVKEDAVGDDWSSALNTFASLKEIEDKSLQNVTKMFQQLSEDEGIEISRGHLFDALLNFSSNFYRPLLEKVNTNEIGDMSRTLEVGTMYALRILTDYGKIENREIMAAFLNYITYECPEHGFVIDYDILKKYLPNVVLSSPDTMGEEVYEIIQNLSIDFMNYISQDSINKIDYSMVTFLDDIIPAGEENDPTQQTGKKNSSASSPSVKNKPAESKTARPKSSGNSRKRTPTKK